ncbi:MAG: cytidine deaminase [Xanthomonadales bacterium]|jgi:cytidine deaminase|nr:cytidine deaminase [Xanthomonadales bacterium]MDH3942271.1 cytidine deaminase [Xanthomonadales bacterium]
MSEFSPVFLQLKEQAVVASAHSYAPYSHFPVGASVIGQDGKIYSGCNVENASFGLTQCAERSALTAAICDGARPGTLQTLVIYTPGDRAHSPCGACRQVMHELMAEDSWVISCCDSDDWLQWTPAQYLPDPFVPDALLK